MENILVNAAIIVGLLLVVCLIGLEIIGFIIFTKNIIWPSLQEAWWEFSSWLE
jgi:hypothetical protein